MSTGLRQFLSKHCVCLWSEKTTVCRIFSCQRSGLPDSAGNLLTSGTFRSATRAALNDRCRRRCRRSSKASSLHRNFSKNPACVRRRDDAIGLTRRNFSARAVRLCLSASAGQLFACIPERKVGGEYRSRTGDLLVANQALSQLS